MTGSVSMSGGMRLGGIASGIVGVARGASVEEKVEFLLERDRKAQVRFDKLETSVAEQPAAWRQDIAEARGELEAFMREQVERERDMHINLRLAGIGFLFAGVLLFAAAN